VAIEAGRCSSFVACWTAVTAAPIVRPPIRPQSSSRHYPAGLAPGSQARLSIFAA
jgi:hypothetical protein